ncbi:MAG: hypothetical protein ACFFAJ_18095, partial [Candidatus Hodarchaeota archaeon]
HYYIRFAPSSTVTFQGKANFLSVEDPIIQDIFSKKRIHRLILKEIEGGERENMTFIKVKPYPKVLCYGLGYNVFKLRKGHTKGGYSVRIPETRL